MVNSKRKAPASSPSSSNPSKKTRPSQDDHSRINPYTGQRNAFPGLDSLSPSPSAADDNEATEDQPEEGKGPDGGDYGIDDAQQTREALKYLRAVRREAAQIPDLLVAPTSKPHGAHRRENGYWPQGEVVEEEEGYDYGYEEYDEMNYKEGYHEHTAVDENPYAWQDDVDDEEDTRGFYSDGAYVAHPLTGPSLLLSKPASDNDTTSVRVLAQVRYHKLLLQRYDKHRQALSIKPPASDVSELDPSLYPTSVEHKHSDREVDRWIGAIAGTDPKRAQLAALLQEDALWILGVLEENVLRREVLGSSEGVGKRVGAWVWGLLGRVAECGTMGSEEVGRLRVLGKKALLIVKEVLEGGQEEVVQEVKEDMVEKGGNIAIQLEASVTADAMLSGLPSATADDLPRKVDGDRSQQTGDSRNPNAWTSKRSGNISRLGPSRPLRRRNSSSSIESYPDEECPLVADTIAYSNCGRRMEDSSNPIPSSHSPRLLARLNNDCLIAEDISLKVINTTSPDPTARVEQSIHDLPHTEDQMYPKTLIANPQPQSQTTMTKDDLLFATLDVILTIVGECYGQRDLLWARDELWSLSE